MIEVGALGRVERPGPGPRPERRVLPARGLHPRLGDGAEVADEVPGRAVRFAAGPGRRQLGQPREAEQPLSHLGLGGEQALAPQADPLDQPPHEDVGAPLLHRRRGFAVELQEGLDPLPRLRLDLGAFQRRLAGRDHVELAAPGDRRQPGQVGGAQLDRGPGQRARRGRRVVGVGEHPQPGDRVADLGTLEERRRPGHVEGDPTLLHRRRDATALHRGGRRPARRSTPARSQRPAGARPPAPQPAPPPARWNSASAAPQARGADPSAQSLWPAARGKVRGGSSTA